ncbi:MULTISPECIES: response regulator transcription factor [unclassified Cryobacterium]|uniref:response regulator n=1 Tax=unclassified Cryobacterium TaxID=2649013 RepID=UPI00106A0707|nr:MULTISPECIES: response regulator transcription factor [unclassified Cryobacterium]TFB97676.1 response regulator transcription factor [Cryobacterium sp. MDB2-A-1]TFC07796.1 response regulator transcription factor [Cryobacterium sp. MDB2-A-2]TFC21028.1 response regulator transcription factor [Cryobacterium sp. MDB2-10]
MTIDARRVVLVDDHALFRSGLSLLLQQDERITIVAEGESGEQAVILALEHRPDVLLLDVEMAGASAESTLRQIARKAPDVAVIILTMHRDSVLRQELLRAGAAAYFTKDVASHDLIAAILAPSRPQTTTAGGDEPARPNKLLSDREMQVLRMVGQAASNKDISSRLSIAEGTVKRHTTNIYAKLGATSRIDAIRKAARLGLFT